MALLPGCSILRISLAFLFISVPVAMAKETVYIKGTDLDGVQRELDVSRRPTLYTGDFADCLDGGSLFNVTKFDAAYYADNASVLFHMDGSTNVRRESLVLHISVEAYGENRFNMTYDPCKANIHSLCPLRAAAPVEAFAVIPISSGDITGIPSLALGIPDLEGFARLQLFANSTQTQIGCFQAVITNGYSFSQPRSVGAVLGGFVFCAILASFATAIYGLSVTAMRTHCGHSFSVLVIFEAFQSIFFSGALSVNWPSVLPAWWSNFAWTAGMFASKDILHSIDPLTGNTGNTSQVGGAGGVTLNNGGGLSQQIYERSLLESPPLRSFARRIPYNETDPYDYAWNGDPRDPRLPMPGTWPGLGGTLSMVNMPPADAFVVGLVWLLALLGAVALFIPAVKLALDSLVKMRWLKTDGFDYFRSHWLGYLVNGLFRTLFVAFFAMMTLTMYQFSLRGSAGPTALAAVIWVSFLFGVGGVAGYACFLRLRKGSYTIVQDTIRFERGKLFDAIPFLAATRASKIREEEAAQRPYLFGVMPFFQIKFIDNDPNSEAVHLDEWYIKRFGWLSARYRRTRWWFFAVYLGYNFVRACFIGGAAPAPLVQVFGLFIFELFALAVIIKLDPFEGSRNTAVAVWIVSISKIVTTGVSIAFLSDFGINRIVAAVLGILIVVVQGFLALAIFFLIVPGVLSSWMSLSRNREKFPEVLGLDQMRIAYFERMEARARDLPPHLRIQEIQTSPPIEPQFNVRAVRRAPKIEDEDAITDMDPRQSPGPNHPDRTGSACSWYSTSSLPRAARTHRASWSSKDLAQWDDEMSRPDLQRISRPRSGSLRKQVRKKHSYENQGNATPTMRPMTPTRELLEEPPVSAAPTTVGWGGLAESDEEKKKQSSIVRECGNTPAPTPMDNRGAVENAHSEKHGAELEAMCPKSSRTPMDLRDSEK